MAEITPAEKLACAEREAKMRKRCYPPWVEQKKMTQQQADHQIACIEAIAADYRAQVEKERLL